MSEPTDPLVGQVLDGRYRVIERIGRGGHGTVYRGWQASIDRGVAIKVLRAEAAADGETRRRFEAEARIISTLRHPSTLKLVDFGQTPDGRLFTVTELLQGETLADRLARGPLPPDAVVRVLRTVAEVLVEAHAEGVIHRDIKPANLFLEQVGALLVVKVLDFGIARLGDGLTTETGKVFGTPAYMSPEQAEGRRAGPESDLYSLGVVGFECLTGGPPFSADSALSLLLKHVHDPPPRLAQRWPADDPRTPLGRLVDGLLAKAPSDRPRSAAEVLRILDGGPPVPVVETTPPPRRVGTVTETIDDLPAPGARGGGWMLAAAAVAVVAVVAVVVGWPRREVGQVMEPGRLGVEAAPVSAAVTAPASAAVLAPVSAPVSEAILAPVSAPVSAPISAAPATAAPPAPAAPATRSPPRPRRVAAPPSVAPRSADDTGLFEVPYPR